MSPETDPAGMTDAQLWREAYIRETWYLSVFRELSKRGYKNPLHTFQAISLAFADGPVSSEDRTLFRQLVRERLEAACAKCEHRKPTS